MVTIVRGGVGGLRNGILGLISKGVWVAEGFWWAEFCFEISNKIHLVIDWTV